MALTEFLTPHSSLTSLVSFVEAPGEPVNVKALREGPRRATVNWEPPPSLDQRDLIGYVVEARESPNIKSIQPTHWTRIGPSAVKGDTKLHLSDINPSTDIQFRVLTRTCNGLSEPSEPTDWLPKPEPRGKSFG